MSSDAEIVCVDATNVGERGFFCFKSKPKSAGYAQKTSWLQERFSEGLRIQIVYEDGRSVGFIEYIPAEFAWRAVKAPGYLLIHCLWVVGRAKNQGYGSRLLDICVADARTMGSSGVAMVTSSKPWLAGSKLLLKHDFERVDEMAPFELLVKRFDTTPLPSFPTDWEARLGRFGAGLTVVRSDQCPYMEDATNTVVEFGRSRGIETEVIALKSCHEVQDTSPTPYGTFAIVHDGRLLSYYYMTQQDLQKSLGSRPGKVAATISREVGGCGTP
jgi:ribosomal protein S18 acetylase RimI-like enzyme